MVNPSDTMEPRTDPVFQTNLKQFDAPTKNKVFGGDKVIVDDVPVIKFNNDESFDEGTNGDSDVISEYIGHYGWWQFFWSILLGLCQCPSTFQIYAFVFQVSLISKSFFFLSIL